VIFDLEVQPHLRTHRAICGVTPEKGGGRGGSPRTRNSLNNAIAEMRSQVGERRGRRTRRRRRRRETAGNVRV